MDLFKITQILLLRNQALNTQNSDEKMQIDKNLSQAITKIFALAESYPDLKANTNFLALQTDLTEIETEIERSKRYYNGTVREFNIGVESFPGNIIA